MADFPLGTVLYEIPDWKHEFCEAWEGHDARTPDKESHRCIMGPGRPVHFRGKDPYVKMQGLHLYRTTWEEAIQQANDWAQKHAASVKLLVEGLLQSPESPAKERKAAK